LSKPDLKTGLVALSRAEVERLDPVGKSGGATVVDFQQYPELWGFVAEAAQRRPVRDPVTGEPAGTRLEMYLQTQHGLMVLQSEHDALAPLFDARVGAPFRASMARDGTFELLVGEPDVELDETSVSEVWKAAADATPDLAGSQEAADEEAAERARLEAAEALLRGGTRTPTR
jgi:hypothetical protein